MYDARNIELEKYQNSNGLFPAAVNSKNELMNNCFWIRDNYYIYLAVESKIKKKIVSAFQGIVDYLDYLGKFQFKPIQDWMYIHPRFDKELKEIPKPWAWVQNDCVGNLLEILAENREIKRADLILNYLNVIKYWDCPDFGFWEEGPKELRSSSLAACIRGIESYENKIKKTEKTKEMKNKGYNSLYSLLPNETKTRPFDLALLSLIYPKQIISEDIKEKIILNTKLFLEDLKGVKRYLGDVWDGKEKSLKKYREMQWTMGLPWLYLCTKEIGYLKRAITIKQKFKTMPEGIINNLPNSTPHLLWSEAMYKLAIDKFIEQNKR